MKSLVRTYVTIAALIGVGVVFACSGDTVSAPARSVGTDGTTGGGTDSSNTPPDTSGNHSGGGSSVELVVRPEAGTVHVQYYLALGAIERDSSGQLVRKQAAWRSLDPAIATVGDTGLVYGAAVGVTKIFATVDGLTDSAVVAVVDTGTTSPPPDSGHVTPPDSSGS